MIYVNKLQILDKYGFVRICSKKHDDKIVKNLFFLQCPRRNCKGIGLRKVWQNDDNLQTQVYQTCPVCDPLFLIICPTCVSVIIQFYCPSYWSKQKYFWNTENIFAFKRPVCQQHSVIFLSSVCMYRYQSEGHFDICSALPSRRTWKLLKENFYLILFKVHLWQQAVCCQCNYLLAFT